MSEQADPAIMHTLALMSATIYAARLSYPNRMTSSEEIGISVNTARRLAHELSRQVGAAAKEAAKSAA